VFDMKYHHDSQKLKNQWNKTSLEPVSDKILNEKKREKKKKAAEEQ